jgi:quercetin dioxygenase-like cupin family protein
MPELRLIDTSTLPFTHDPRFPGIGIRVVESRETHPAFSLIIARIDAGKMIQRHVHPTETETAYVLSGSAVLALDDAEYTLMQGMVVTIPPGTPHSLRNNGEVPIEVVAMHAPPNR